MKKEIPIDPQPPEGFRLWGPVQDGRRQAAEVLAAIFAAHNAPDLKFAPALCLSADLAKQKSYEFGREWDHVCSRCGGVFASTVPNEVPVCAGCAVVLYRMAMY